MAAAGPTEAIGVVIAAATVGVDEAVAAAGGVVAAGFLKAAVGALTAAGATIDTLSSKVTAHATGGPDVVVDASTAAVATVDTLSSAGAAIGTCTVLLPRVERVACVARVARVARIAVLASNACALATGITTEELFCAGANNTAVTLLSCLACFGNAVRSSPSLTLVMPVPPSDAGASLREVRGAGMPHGGVGLGRV